MKKISVLLCIFLVVFLTACSSQNTDKDEGTKKETTTESTQLQETTTETEIIEEDEELKQEATDIKVIYAHVGNEILEISLEENSSAEAFVELLEQGDITIDMHDYGSFEKVGDIGSSLPTNDKRFTTEPGDVILYLGNQITIYYGTNTWSFTKLGGITNASEEELRNILGGGNVSVTFSVNGKSR